MWGGIFLETIFTGNYTFGFLSNRSNNLLHLTHWQYWFWFWFSWYLGLYYIIFMNFFFKRTIFAHPKIATSFRSHGKWGDLLVCAVPLSWCFNILINSNFLLRLVEWQHASTYFSLRVRGKQWYWLYLVESTFFQKIKETRQIGWAHWTMPSESLNQTTKELHRLLQKESNSVLWTKNLTPVKSIGTVENLNLPFNPVSFKQPLLPDNESINLSLNNHLAVESLRLNKAILGSSWFYKTQLNFKSNGSPINFDIQFAQLNNQTSLTDLYKTTQTPAKFSNEILTAVFKQKRFSYSPGNQTKNTLITSSPTRSNLNTISPSETNAFIFNKRLLRTNKILLLPTNVNISVITNSFDVIHSWFIPGLGLKLDCVPGRSTQHTLHIMTPGFYYGQCAEICGRYHHHMPIRICAVSTPHFLFWWANKGVQGITKTHFSNIS